MHAHADPCLSSYATCVAARAMPLYSSDHNFRTSLQCQMQSFCSRAWLRCFAACSSMDFGTFVGFVLLLLCFVAPSHHCIGVVIVQRECAEGCCRITCKPCLAVHSASLLSECVCDGVLRERRCKFAVAKGALLLCCVTK